MGKLKIQNRFGIIPNDLLNNTKITFKAKGLFGYLQSKPDDWNFSVSRIKNDTKDGKDGITSGLQELEKAGYLHRNKFKNDKGQWDIDYILYDTPIAEKQQRDKKTIPENPLTENPLTENPETYKKRVTKKDIIKKEYINNAKINEKFLLFIEHRKQMKKPMTEIAIEQAVKKINKWFEKYSQEQIEHIIGKSIENGWQGLFENQVGYFRPPQKKLAHEVEDRNNFSF